MQVNNLNLLDQIANQQISNEKNNTVPDIGEGSKNAVTSSVSGASSPLRSINIDSHNYGKNGKNNGQGGNPFGNGGSPSQDASALKREKMIIASMTMSGKDVAKLSEDGLSAKDMVPEEYTDIADKIRVALAKGGADMSITGGVDKDMIADVTGSSNYAAVMEKALQNNDLPTDKESVKEAAEALQKAETVMEKIPGQIPRNVQENLLRYENEPTVGNLFDSMNLGGAGGGIDISVSDGTISGSATENASASGFGEAPGVSVYSEGGNSIYSVIPADMILQVQKVIKEAGLSVDADTMNAAADMIKKHIPLTSENMFRASELSELRMPDLTLGDAAQKIADTILEGKNAEDTNLFKPTLMEQAREIYNTVFSDNSIEPSDDEKTNSIGDIAYRRQLEETRLSMTVSANFVLLKRGVSIDTTDLSKVVEDLKALEREYAESFFKGYGVTGEGAQSGIGSTEAAEETDLAARLYGDAEVSIEKLTDSFLETNSAIDELKSAPAAVLGRIQNINIETVTSLNRTASPLRAQLEAAGERYETMRTEIRRDLGDSIKKAFRNIDELLTETDMDLTEENRRAVRILAYNKEEITKENIENIKLNDSTVQRAFNALKPAVVAEMLKQGKNPLDMTMDELIKTAEEIEDELPGNRTEDRFARFLRKLEEHNGITAEEKEGYIGIYRLIHQVNASDGAAIGMLLQSGQDITMRNLMRAERTRKHENREAVIDDSFGLLSDFKRESLTITQQIELAFNQNEMKDAEQNATPYKMSQYNLEEELMEMTPEELNAAMKETEEPEELEEAYRNEELEEIRKNVMTEEEVYRMLERFDVPASPNHLAAMQELMQNRAFPFQTLTKNRKVDKEILAGGMDDIKDITMDDIIDDLIEEYGESVKTPEDMAKAQKKLADTAENVMRKALIDDGLADNMDIRALQMAGVGLSVFSAMTQSETYNIPVNVEDGTGNMTVKIVRGTDQKGLVDIMFNSTRTGKMRAGFKYEKDEIEGNILTDTAEMREYMAEQAGLLADAMQERTGFSFSLSVRHDSSIEEADIFRDTRVPFETTKEKEEASTKALYGIAKAFLDFVKEMA